ncbi:U-box domain-containing protein 34 [Nymphaea thermarum]|nr:U-box domain-containing protein 34 [Nymphaea thermarum]
MGSTSAEGTPGNGPVVARRTKKEVVVAVGVCEKSSSKRAFQWAIDNLAGVDRFVLVHVTPPITSIPTPGKMDSLKENYETDNKTGINEKRDNTSLYKKLFKFDVPRADKKKDKLSSFALPQDREKKKLSELGDGGSSPRLSNTSKHTDISYTPPVEEERLGMSHEENHLPGKDAKIPSARDYNGLLGVKDNHFLVQSPARPAEAKSEVEHLRLELQFTLSMYNRTCEELVYAKKKAQRLSVECAEEAKKVKDAQEKEEIARKAVEEEKAKHMSALKEVEAAKQLLAKEAYARQKAEVAALKESSERRKLADALFSSDQRYRRYSREELENATESFSVSKKIGEGGYGSVYKCNLDHTPVAVKLLHQDASNKKDEFLREVEVLSQIRHPHMVLLLGACPENGCLVYEYLANGSLEDRLLCKGGTPPLSWPTRFRILYEVACALAFLHSSKPEPIVHRDLKPANILLDSNYVSKIGDVGLAQLMSNVVPDTVTEYRETLLAGTLYYMDPEYQRTGTVRPKSDLYGFGIIMLQILTAKPPSGLVKMIETSIDNGSFSEKLDKSIKDWPLAQCEDLAQLALKCTRLRCRDRPDLELEVIPELQRFKDVADALRFKMIQGNISIPRPYVCPILQELMIDPHVAADGFTYEYRAIKAWLTNHDVSPMTKHRLQHLDLTPNLSLRSAIQDWKRRVVSSSGI